MPRRTIQTDGRTWGVSLTGRRTVYARDEVSLMFTSDDDGMARERRVTRFSPLGARSPDMALNELTDAQLRDLLATSQPAEMAPETGYRP
jgi:hypothetical protein